MALSAARFSVLASDFSPLLNGLLLLLLLLLVVVVVVVLPRL
jgi:hypothetical protein